MPMSTRHATLLSLEHTLHTVRGSTAWGEFAKP
jgi:hypothetical protein